MPEKVGKELIKKEPGFLYYVKEGFVWASPMPRNKEGKKHQVSKEKIETDKAFMYFVGKSGYVERAPRKQKKAAEKK
jgi:hypothetical protein